jgi:hypothetical protein
VKPLGDGTIGRLLDRQAKLWETQRQPGPRDAETPRANLTLSSRPHSGARALAGRIAEICGWEVYDHQILDALHADDALGKSVLESLDERLLGYREDWLYHIFVPQHMPSPGYVHRLSQLVFSLAMQGRSIFVGRGSSFIVPCEHRLAVLVVRGFDARLEAWLHEHGSGSRTAARRALARLDRERGEFVWRSFHRAVDDPLVYDLCVNLDSLDTDAAARVVLEALRARYPNEALRAPEAPAESA